MHVFVVVFDGIAGAHGVVTVVNETVLTVEGVVTVVNGTVLTVVALIGSTGGVTMTTTWEMTRSMNVTKMMVHVKRQSMTMMPTKTDRNSTKQRQIQLFIFFNSAPVGYKQTHTKKHRTMFFVFGFVLFFLWLHNSHG